MALNNTSDRYRYIYGNTVRKYDYNIEETSPRKEKQSPKRRPSASTAKWVDTLDRKFMIMSVLAITLVIMMAFLYVYETSMVTSLSKQVRSLTEEKADLQSKQSSIQSELDKALNLDEIQEYAKKNLDMISPDYDDYIYYNQESSDYFRQYESVDK